VAVILKTKSFSSFCEPTSHSPFGLANANAMMVKD